MGSSYFTWTLANATGEIGVVAEATMYHATRAAHVQAILREGLRLGTPARGFLSSSPEQARHWSDEFYGRRPLYLLAKPRLPAGFGLETLDLDAEDPYEPPVMLAVDARGLRLLPDLPTLEYPYKATAFPDGLGWRNSRPMAREPDRNAVPAEFAPYADHRGIVRYPILVAAAALTALTATSTAAVLEDVGPTRVRVLSGP
jgi:hypothetical protein